VTIVDEALIFACGYHASVGQTRKYTGEPYIVHPIEVMMLVREHGGTEAMQAAALLHDVIEDTPATEGNVREAFGDEVADMVLALSDLEEGNRATRKRLSLERLAASDGDVQTIKLADLISNTRTIVERDPDFAKVYLREKAALLEALTKGSRTLRSMAWDMVPESYRV